MNKILKYIFITLTLAVCFLFCIEIKYPILNKYLIGNARIINNEIKCEISINGNFHNDCKLFKVNSNFYENEKRDYYVLYCRNENIELPVIIIDKEFKMVLIPNDNIKDYNIIFNKLFQSDSGANVMIPLNNKIKGYGFEPNLKINGSTIIFNIPNNKKTQKVVVKLLF